MSPVYSITDVSPPEALTELQLTPQDATGVSLSWTGVFERGYRVEHSFNLQSDSWQPIGAGGGNASASTKFFHSEFATQPQGFYRILPAL